MQTALFLFRSHRDPENRDRGVRMYDGWYTRRVIIRTFIREIFEREAFVVLAVVCYDVQVIVEDVDRIDEGFDDVAAEKRIVPVAGGEAVQKEQHPIAVHQLGLGKAESLTGDAEGFRFVLQFLQHGGGRGVPDPGGDGAVHVVNLLPGLRVFGLHCGQGGGLQLLRLEGHDGVHGFVDLIIGEDAVQDEEIGRAHV